MLLERCPVCRAKCSDADPIESPCRRCGAEIQHLRALSQQEEALKEEMFRAWHQGAFSKALQIARQRAQLHTTPETKLYLSIAYLATCEPSESLLTPEQRQTLRTHLQIGVTQLNRAP